MKYSTRNLDAKDPFSTSNALRQRNSRRAGGHSITYDPLRQHPTISRAASFPPQHYPEVSPPSSWHEYDGPPGPVSAMGAPSVQQTFMAPLERRERPLPATPAQFRLGEDDLPWSTPLWYLQGEPEYMVQDHLPTPIMEENEDGHFADDPQRVREMEILQQAMMAVDMGNNEDVGGWNTEDVGSWKNRISGTESGPVGASLGWAVSSNDRAASLPASLSGSLSGLGSLPVSPVSASGAQQPPTFVASQWEEAFAPRDWSKMAD